MASDDSLPTLKLLLIGPSGAGKSACKSTIPVVVPHRGGRMCDVLGVQSSLLRTTTDGAPLLSSVDEIL